MREDTPASVENTTTSSSRTAKPPRGRKQRTTTRASTSMLRRRTSSSRSRPSRQQRTSLSAGLAILSGRAAGAISRRLNLGGGTSIVGLVAQRLYPNILPHLAQQLEHGNVAVTGTNGKTTTCGFIAAILSDAGLRVWRNREGSNLMGGIASSLVMRGLPNGHLRRSGRAISVIEVDEAVVPLIVQTIPPRLLVFTNLFRDQLDRFGEVDSIATRWHKAVNSLPEDAILILNADDPATAYLSSFFSGLVLYFGIDDPSLDIATQPAATQHHQVMDARTCPRCGGELLYTLRFYSHMGHYRCTQCDFARPQPDVRASDVQSDTFDRTRIQLHMTKTSPQELTVPLPGIYNLYNALAAATAAQALDIGWGPIVTGIEQFKPIFGRGERLQIEGRTVRLLLAKNPTGFNEVLRTLFSEGAQRHVLFVLNDNIADGRDISWIWDVDFERMLQQTATLVVAGSRALDLAIRLKYAGFQQEDMSIVAPAPLRASQQGDANHNRLRRTAKNRIRKQSRNIATPLPDTASGLPQHYGLAAALNEAIRQTPVGETLFVVPTYTGLLEIHHELEQRGLTPHYWEGKDN